MRVLQVNSVCGVGSTGRIVTDLYNVLEAQGHKCCIAYGRGSAPNGFNTIRIGSDLAVNMHAIYTRITDKTGFASTIATKRFIEQIDAYNPDVIHLHNLHGYYINIKILFNYLKVAKKPVIWTLHDCWAFTGHCSYFDFAGCEKWRTGCNHCPQKGKYPKSMVKDNSEWNYHTKMRLFTQIDDMTIVTPSEWLAGIVGESFLGKYSVSVINNGIDLDVFKPTPGSFRERYDLDNKFIVLGVANYWEPRKGFDIFIELSKKLDTNYQIVMVGVSKKLKDKLPQNIIGITRTDNVKELAEIYTAADVFVNPSVEETMGLVTVEALACGTPAIVSNKTAVPEAVDSSCGVVVTMSDFDGFLEAIKTASRKPFDSSACIVRSKRYGKQIRYLQYLNLYKKIEGLSYDSV